MSAWLAACNSSSTPDDEDSDGVAGETGSGGKVGSGGKSSSGGKGSGAGGKVGSGGKPGSAGGESSGGAETGSGGDESGGSAGELQTGGAGGDEAAGGAPTGGAPAGGAPAGGAPAGGAESGGAESGGSGSGVGGGSGGSGPVGPSIVKSHELMLNQVTASTKVRDIRGLAYAANGNLYASGYALDALGDASLIVLRILPNGTLDTTFGDEGVASFDLVDRDETVVGVTSGGANIMANSGAENSFGVVELEDGDVVVQVAVTQDTASGATAAAGTWVGLIRLDSEGDLVSDFGNTGIVQVQFGYELGGANAFADSSWGLALDTFSEPGTEKIVVTGFGTAPLVSGRTDNDRYITRVLAENGEVDATFNGGEPFSFNSNGVLSDGGRRAIVLPDGGIVSSGYTNLGGAYGGNSIILIQLTAAGVPDPGFGFTMAPASDLLGTTKIDGVAILNPFAVDGGVAECYATTRQSTGRLVTTGYGTVTGSGAPSTLGYITSSRQDVVSTGVLAGGLDPAFGNSGHFAIQSEGTPPPANLTVATGERFEERGREVVALADDRLVFAGRYDVKPSLSVVLPNGGLDDSVGDVLDGHFVYDAVPQDATHFYSVAQSSDGSLLAAATDGSVTDGVFIAVLNISE